MAARKEVLPVEKPIGSYPRVRIESGGRTVVSQAGGVLLVETVRKAGLDTAISAALMPWRKPRAVHDPGKVLLDVALAVALGGDCLADAGMLRAEPAVFGQVASDPTVSRLIDTLAASEGKLWRRSALPGPKRAPASGSWPASGRRMRTGRSPWTSTGCWWSRTRTRRTPHPPGSEPTATTR